MRIASHSSGSSSDGAAKRAARRLDPRRRASVGGERRARRNLWTFGGPLGAASPTSGTRYGGGRADRDAARIALLIDLSLPALKARLDAGDRLQPAWGRFLDRMTRYGLPAQPRVRHLRSAGPLATLVIAYRH
jgi:hypothetical protein